MKTAIVTGGGGGIGRSIVERLARDGYRIAVGDRKVAAANEVAAQVDGATAYQLDVTDEASIAAMLGACGDRPDLLVNAAGVIRVAGILDQTVADFRRVVEVNLIGAFAMSRAVARGMTERGSGCIVNISSVASITPNPDGGAYSPSKAGLTSLTKLMALELGPKGIRVNSIAPGLIGTGMGDISRTDPEVAARRKALVPSRDLGVGDDVAGIVAFLASDAARYINGEQIVVDGALTLTVLSQLSPA